MISNSLKYQKQLIFVTWRSSTGGIEVQIPDIIKSFDQTDVLLYVLRSKDKNGADIFENSGLKVIYGSNITFLIYIKFFLFALKNKRAGFYGFNLGPYILFLLRLAGIKHIIYFIHGTKYWKNNLQKYVRKFFWNMSISGIIFMANSEYSRNVFLNSISSRADVQVIYNMFDTDIFKPVERDFNLRKLNICYVGRLAQGKNLKLWIDTAEKILQVYPEFRFNIYGDGPLRNEILKLIKAKDLINKINIHGDLKNISSAYQMNDLLLFLSEYESFGNVVVESILCGTPVIASRIPSTEEIFHNHPELLVDLDENIFTAVIGKIRNYAALKSIALKMSAEFTNDFSIERYVSKLKDIYTYAG